MTIPYETLHTTRAILDRLRVEERLKRLPSTVHAAFRKRALLQRGWTDYTLTEEEQALIARYPEYQRYADQAMANWRTVQLPNGTEVDSDFIIRLIVATNQASHHLQVGPFFLSQPEEPTRQTSDDRTTP